MILKTSTTKNTSTFNINLTSFKKLSGLFCICFLSLFNSLFSQGLIEVPLTTNKILIEKSKEVKSVVSQRGTIADTINLDPVKGILDDFSYEGPYPDSALWLDSMVFINRGYPISPVTIGAATFDGLNAQGYPYDFTATPTSSGPADRLTSKPINLNYPASDSIYLSFYYQPQGRGNSPELPDSLALDFKAAGASGWKNVWAKKGSSLSTNDSSWKLVMVPITDSAFLRKGFQFRFRNNATLSGSLDHWSIDYVYLNRIRNQYDTAFEDISFVYDLPSMINNYTAMPWNHYNTSFMKTSYSTTIRNNHTVVKNGSFSYKIYDITGTQVNTTYLGGNTNIPPSPPYLNDPPFTNPPLNYTIPALTSNTGYTIECAVNSTPDFFRKNDTVRHVQKFANYYAYDDGSAEEAFGLGSYNGAMMAEQFTCAITDTLRCIDIYFDPVVTDASQYTFRFNVWNDSGGQPGTAVYTSDSVAVPTYNKTGYDQFTRYFLRTPLRLGVGIFYIGFQQNTDQFLNVGVDKNTNSQDKIFYNIAGTWNSSPYPGSLMMHPVFGSLSYALTGVDNYTPQNNLVTIYPNPANDKLFIRSNNSNPSQKIIYSVMDLFGRTILENSATTSEYIDISAISEGVYFIRIIDGVNVSTTKFIKVN